MTILFSLWVVLALAVLSLAGYRKMVSRNEDDLVHLSEADATLVNNQKSIATRLEWIDKWGKILTVVTLIFGIIVAGIYLYNGWMASGQLQS